jgi:hypothetical protein
MLDQLEEVVQAGLGELARVHAAEVNALHLKRQRRQ